jgi:putative FmdB family regulatory protein
MRAYYNPPMPIFEYACRSCGNEFETLLRASETPACTQCASRDLEKKLSVFAAQTGGATAAAAAPGPCGTCGNPNGPGSCAFN